MARRENSNRWYMFVALVIAVLLWGVAHGSSSVERGLDLPVAFRGVPEDLVITDQSTDVVNVRVLGSRAALRNLDAVRAEYPVDASGAKSGSADFEVDVSRVDLPRGARIVSRSPSQLEVKFERRGTKVMQVRADLAGEPAQGFVVAGVEIEPPRVRVTGARAQVLRLDEAVTEPIDISGLAEPAEREARLSLGGENVWVEEPTTVKVRVRIEPAPPPEAK